MVIVLGTICVLGLFSCGGGTTFNLSNESGNSSSPSSSVSISLQTAPPASLPVSFTAQLTALVTNDPSNSGVDWSVTCPVQDCGSFTLANKQGQVLHAESGQTVTYEPPSSFSHNQLAVNIVAFATADHTKNVVAAINITGFLSNFNGTYVFQARGSDSDLTTGVVGPFQIAGAITLDGNGGISAGELSFSDSSTFKSTVVTGGSYTLSPDGSGTLTIKTSNKTLGNNGTQTFSLVYLDGSELLITQTDGSASTAGRMMLQTASIGALAGGYAFAVSGVDSNGFPTAFGGVFNIDQPNQGTISGNGSLADQGYLSTDTATGKLTLNVRNCPAPTVTTPTAGLTGTVLPIPGDRFGAIRLTLTACFASSPLQFTGFPIDAEHLLLMETDNDGAGNGFSTSGIAIGQGNAAGRFVQTFSSNYIFGVSGFDSSGSASSLAAAGRIAPNGTGVLQGFIDEFGFSGSPSTSEGIQGSYSEDPTGSGRVDISTSSASGSGTAVPGPKLIFYQTGAGNPVPMLTLDSNAAALGAGVAYQQASSPSEFSGDFGFIAHGLPAQSNPSTSDVAGQMTATADQATNSSQVAGLLYSFAAGNDAMPITGSFTIPADNARFIGRLSVPLDPTTPNPAALALYLIDDSHGFVLETDSPVTGSVLFGYVAARAPVCQGCP